ncbi:hypothetical protein M5689_001667 [Euphorbia peplus]|nr:hypothetical protein M5689_001667 [Euphorbia peplus]
MDLQEWRLLNKVQEEEDEDTLSLCDLALNSVSDSDGSFQEDRLSSTFDQEIFDFEFISSDFSATLSAYPKDNIIFCGKMIPYKEDQKKGEEATDSIISIGKSKTVSKSFIFPWKYSYSVNIPRSTSVKMEAESKTFPESTEEEDFAAKKGGRRRRSRWYLFAFGMGRYKGEMELKDIKTRQSKMISDGKMRRSLKYDAMEDIESYESSRSEKSKWWSLVRILGCQSSHANAMVKASLGLMPN